MKRKPQHDAATYEQNKKSKTQLLEESRNIEHNLNGFDCLYSQNITNSIDNASLSQIDNEYDSDKELNIYSDYPDSQYSQQNTQNVAEVIEDIPLETPVNNLLDYCDGVIDGIPCKRHKELFGEEGDELTTCDTCGTRLCESCIEQLISTNEMYCDKCEGVYCLCGWYECQPCKNTRREIFHHCIHCAPPVTCNRCRHTGCPTEAKTCESYLCDHIICGSCLDMSDWIGECHNCCKVLCHTCGYGCSFCNARFCEHCEEDYVKYKWKENEKSVACTSCSEEYCVVCIKCGEYNEKEIAKKCSDCGNSLCIGCVCSCKPGCTRSSSFTDCHIKFH